MEPLFSIRHTSEINLQATDLCSQTAHTNHTLKLVIQAEFLKSLKQASLNDKISRDPVPA